MLKNTVQVNHDLLTTHSADVIGFLAIAVLIILALIPRAPSDPCGTAEFAPDVPTHIKEQCRQHRRIKI